MLKINEKTFISNEKTLDIDYYEEEKYTCFKPQETNQLTIRENYIIKNEMKKVDIFEKENFYRR
ncbi:MAG: hypothetical protein ACRCW7_11790 [Cetobacterium sp.]